MSKPSQTAAFHAAIREERLDDAVAMLEAQPALLEARCDNDWGPLIVAAYAGAGASIALLLARGADPNAANAKGTVPLMYAKGHYLRTGDSTPMRQLLAGGSDPHIRDTFGLTLLDYVPEERRVDVAAILDGVG